MDQGEGSLRSLRDSQPSGAALHGRRRETALKESAIELIADLLHWTSARGLDLDDVLDQAQMHYEAETEAAS
ncbi:hypothetical protein ACFW5I_00375 [Streptomyces sp. NPDC058818]|uniref:hypothetical protein n=1 Tax=Streptomyces sp. NPDC058818 TaxID=3346640 RepID=UPI003698E24E